MAKTGLEALIEEGTNRGGRLTSHRRGDLGFGYVEQFDASQIGRSGGQLVRPPTVHGDHYDVTERFSNDIVLHHRIYKP